MQLTEQITKLAHKMKVKPEMIVFADLLFIGFNEVDAYKMAYPNDECLTLSMQKRKRKEIISSNKFKELCEQRRELHSRVLSIPANNADIDLIDSLDVAKEILLSAKSLPSGSKERAELFIKFNEVMQEESIDVSEPGDGTDNIQFYFSEKCEKKCPLHLTYMKHWKRFQNEHRSEDVDAKMDLKPVIRETKKIVSLLFP